MKWNLAGLGLVAVLSGEFHTVPADACGVKLAVKTVRPRKGVARTSRPSQLLLVGTPPRRLERDLSAAGHKVEVEPSLDSAQKQTYAVVIVDSNDQATAARAKFNDAIVVVRSGDVTADMRSVEDRVARKPLAGGDGNGRVVVAARVIRTPVAASERPDARVQVAVKEPDESPSPASPPEPVKVRTQVEAKAPPVEGKAPPVADKPPAADKPPVKIVTAAVKPEETAPKHSEPTPKPAAATSAELHSEVYFTVGSAKLSGNGLAKATHWLTTNVDVHVVVEGYADPTGSAESNMTLSQSRAETVRDKLVSAGIDQSRIEVQAFGDTKMKYGRTDSRNRRVAVEAKK